MRRSPWRLIAFGVVIWVILLGCRTSDVIARVQSSASATSTRSESPARTSPTPRPTFTRVAPSIPPPSPAARAPTTAPLVGGSLPTPLAVQPPPTHVTQPGPPVRPPTAPPPPTADPYQGYYYRVMKNVCVTAPNTRAEGIVLNNGVPENGVRVRVANGNGGDPVIDDYVTGIDPASNNKHTSPEWKGKYRLGIAEGLQMAGNWWVFIVDAKGQQISVGAYFNTHDSDGCNTAFIDFAH